MPRTRPFATRGRPTLVVALLAMVALAGPAIASDGDDGVGPSMPTSNTQEGWVIVPTHPSGRVFSASTLEGVTHEIVDVVPMAPFTLKGAFGSEAGSCVLTACVQTSDFDIAFMRDNGDGTTTLLQRAAVVGDEEGTVPREASLGIVYLRTPGAIPELKGYRFAYGQGDP